MTAPLLGPHPANDRDDREASLHNILRIVVAGWFAALPGRPSDARPRPGRLTRRRSRFASRPAAQGRWAVRRDQGAGGHRVDGMRRFGNLRADPQFGIA